MFKEPLQRAMRFAGNRTNKPLASKNIWTSDISRIHQQLHPRLQRLHSVDVILKWVFFDKQTTVFLRTINRHFDDEYYLAANEDVAAAQVDPFLHFLSHGLTEGRAPSPNFSNQQCRDELLTVLGSDEILRRQMNRVGRVRRVSACTPVRLAGRQSKQGGPFWARPSFANSEIDLCYIRASNEWQSEQATLASAISQFQQEYSTRLLPFSYEFLPDVQFFQDFYGTELSALEIQREWACAENSRDTFVSLAHFLKHYCGDGGLIFDGYDHLDYVARNPTISLDLNELQAFGHFISIGLEQGLRPPQSLSPALIEIIDARLQHLDCVGSDKAPFAAFRLKQSGVRTAAIDRFSCEYAAIHCDLGAMTFEATDDQLSTFWINFHSATANTGIGQHSQAVVHAHRALDCENGSVLALDKVHDTVSRLHQDLHRSLQVAAKSVRAMPAEQDISDAFTKVLKAVPHFSAGDMHAVKKSIGHGIKRIGILADLSLPQCKRYRVDQKVEYLQNLGVEARVFDVHRDLDNAGAESALFDLWICYRTPAYYGVLKLLKRARDLKVPTIFEIDDLILDPAFFPEPRESYGSAIDDRQYAELRVLPFLYAAVARSCDFGIASTEALSGRLRLLVRSGRSFILPNGVDSLHTSAMQSLVPKQGTYTSDIVRVFVGSATKSHKDHVSQVFVPQAVKIAEAFDGKVQFSLCGAFEELYARLDATARRSISHIDLGWDYSTYLSTLSGFDINVVPLEQSSFTDCKSEIKWLEASLLGVPSVLAATDTYKRSIDDGTTGLLVRNQDYMTPIRRLCESASDRARIGKKAQSIARSLFSTERQCTILGDILDQIEALQ